MAEFLGTFVLLAFGDGVVAMAVAALPGSGRAATPTTIFNAAGDWLLITWGWAIAVAMGIWVAGGVTGAHINPAVTLALAVRRKFAWAKVVPYWGSQLVGAFVGAAVVYMVYQSSINATLAAEGAHKSAGNALVTYSIFATFPAPYFHGSWVGPFMDQIVGTAFLLMFVVAITDSRNLLPGANMTPLIVGLVVAAVGMSYGANAGYAINPARDFGPRLFAYAAGWGKVAMPGTDHTAPFMFSNYFWIPIVGPLAGGIIGVLIYDWFVGDVLHARLSKAQVVEVPPGRAGPEHPTGEVV